MKPKPLAIGVALAIALAVGTWLWLHRGAPGNSVETAKTETRVASGSAARPVARNGNAPSVSSATASKTAALTPNVQIIVEARRDYEDRMFAVSSLSTNMATADWEGLRHFLITKDPGDAEQLGQVLKNRLMDTLCVLNPPPEWLGEIFSQMYRDRNQDIVIRDYAVQHLASYYEQLEVAQIGDAQIQRNIQDELWRALSEIDSSIAGTALLGLERLSRGRPEFDRQRVTAAALKLAGDKETGELTRITAFQVCAESGLKEALPLALQAAQNSPTVPLQISAISALGLLGGEEVKPFLTSLANGDDRRLRLPAQQALNQIQRQEQQKTGEPNI